MGKSVFFFFDTSPSFNIVNFALYFMFSVMFEWHNKKIKHFLKKKSNVGDIHPPDQFHGVERGGISHP